MSRCPYLRWSSDWEIFVRCNIDIDKHACRDHRDVYGYTFGSADAIPLHAVINRLIDDEGWGLPK